MWNIPQEDGFKVWIDVDQMEGSTLEAMAAAVENAAVVIIAVSEKYKQSPNCRTGPSPFPWFRNSVGPEEPPTRLAVG